MPARGYRNVSVTDGGYDKLEKVRAKYGYKSIAKMLDDPQLEISIKKIVVSLK